MDLQASMIRSVIDTEFMARMLICYPPPRHVSGDDPAVVREREALLECIAEAALLPVPSDWPQDRVRVYASQLWRDGLLTKKYAGGWPEVDAVAKTGMDVVARMTAHDRPRLDRPEWRLLKNETTELMGEELDFPSFYWRMRGRLERDQAVGAKHFMGNPESHLATLEVARKRWLARYPDLEWPQTTAVTEAAP